MNATSLNCFINKQIDSNISKCKEKKKKPRKCKDKCTRPAILEGVMESVTLKTQRTIFEIFIVTYRYVRGNIFMPFFKDYIVLCWLKERTIHKQLN